VVIAALDRKLLRDLTRLRGQVVTIALVVACGIASYATLSGTWYSLDTSRATYYERYRFADVFVHLERAPDALEQRIEAIEGVALAYSRLRERVKIRMPGMQEPAFGHVLSVPASDEPPLNGLHLLQGRMPAFGHADEVVVLETFVEAHGLALGDSLDVVINGKLKPLRIVGVAMCPEYVLPVPEGEMMPDKKRFTVLWMERSVVAAAFRLEGAFNDLVLKLQPGASLPAVLEQVNQLLEPYGGLGAYGRARQLSHQVVDSEIAQLEVMGLIVPAIFLGVAAFLVNVVLSRLILLQRGQIAILKALGYSNLQVGLHYLKLVSVIVLLGSVLGFGLGVYLGRGMTHMYTEWLRFPELRYVIEPRVMVVGIGVSLLSALTGALFTVRAVVALPPAEAMRPATPTTYRTAVTERLRLQVLFGQSARMVLREVERRPLRLLLSCLGISMAVAILVAGRFFYDGIDKLMDLMFNVAQREHLAVTFTHPVPERASFELARLPGVLHSEGLRMVAVRFRSGHHMREQALVGYSDEASLRRIVDAGGRVRLPPARGVMLSSLLAERLELEPGDSVRVEILEGQRAKLDVVVAGVVDDVVGMFGYMRRSELNRLLGEDSVISQAVLAVDTNQYTPLYRALERRPGVLAVSRLDRMVAAFRAQTAEQMQTFTFILTLFASVIAIGVVYNNARVSLADRSRDLASLRVLGFRRREISAILLGELAIQLVLALPVGMLIGTWLAHGMMANVDLEQYRFPVVVSPRTYAFAAMVTLGAGLASALLVRRKLDRLDLIAVLKTRE
jgi:putative ABC transport system permease protein